MSNVPAEARTATKLECLINARTLCTYTLKILQNNEHFKILPSGNKEKDKINPPQPELVTKLRDTVLDVYISAYSANEVYLNEENYRMTWC